MHHSWLSSGFVVKLSPTAEWLDVWDKGKYLKWWYLVKLTGEGQVGLAGGSEEGYG